MKREEAKVQAPETVREKSTPEPTPITAQDAYPDIFHTATRVDIVDLSNLENNCTNISDYEKETTEKLAVEVVFVRQKSGVGSTEISESRIGIYAEEDWSDDSGLHSHFSFESVISNPWNEQSNSSNPIIVYRYKNFLSDWVNYRNKHVVSFLGQGQPWQFHLSDISREMRLTDIIPGSFIVAWYVE
jgi:hypothetical protein